MNALNNLIGRAQAALTRLVQNGNGPDTLARWSLVAGVACTLLDAFVGSAVLSALGLGLLGYSCFRCFSGNVAQRALENARFEHAVQNPKARAAKAKRRWTTRKTTRYFTCAQCGQELSVPKGKGTLRATCPKCGAKTTIES